LTNDKLPFARCANGKRIKKNRLGFLFLFSVGFHVSMSMSSCLHVSVSPCLHVSMSPSLHVSMSPCLHVSMSPCLHVTMSSCFHVSISPCLHSSMSPCLNVHVSMFPEFRKQKTEQILRKRQLPLFAANGKRKRQTSVVCCKHKLKVEICFPLSANDK
jgi:hypothetical protein